MSLILTSSFAERLKEALENTTTTEFAEAVGVSKQTISAYTTGVRKPKAPTIKVMADILKVNAAWLLGYDVAKNTGNISSENGSVTFRSEEIGYGSNSQFSNDEVRIITIYQSFNSEGKRKTIEYIQDLEMSGKYTKNSSDLSQLDNL
ncbi:MAG: helix-turn-helix domain-containing protein [Eubacteriales bacterium]